MYHKSLFVVLFIISTVFISCRAVEQSSERVAEPPVVVPADTRADTASTVIVRRAFSEGLGAHENAYERMTRQLSKHVSMEFLDTPLLDTISFISQSTGLNLIVSQKVRESNPPVTLRVNDMEVAAALRWITQLTGTHAEVKDEAIFINDKASADVDDDEKQDIMMLAATLGATVEVPPPGVALTNAERAKIALALWEKEEPKIQDFPAPDVSLGVPDSNHGNAASTPFIMVGGHYTMRG